MSQPPAAWHPDPENPNQLRWWDGQRWTAATAPSPAAAATSQRNQPHEPVASDAVKRRTGWRIAGVIAASLLVGGILARVAPVVMIFAIVAAIIVALFVLLVRPAPALGLRSRRSGLVALGVAALLVTGGGIASASTGSTTPTASEAQTFATLPTATATASPSPTPTPTPVPTTFQTATEEVLVPFESSTVDDPELAHGTTTLVSAGVDGVKVITYRVTVVDGVETAREVVSEVLQTAPVNEVTAVGSKVLAPAPVAPVAEPAPAPAPAPAPEVVPAPVPAAPVPAVPQGGGCDSNYADACVPVASDVDCAGGSGDGPGYVQGPVRIVGSDIYDLDRDGDGIACDK
nr:G5 domain-containing protein [Microbacterium hydrocarbonoxydans]